METAVKLARIGNFILSLMAVCIMILMLAYGGYSLWDNYMINSGAFLTSDLLKYKPPENSDAEDNLSLEELMALNPGAGLPLTEPTLIILWFRARTI